MTDYAFKKILFFCEKGVGKTTFVKRYCINGGAYLKKTIGAHIFKLKQDMNLHGDNFSLCFWDVSVRGSMRSLKPLYYQGAEGAIFMYDITNKKTLNYFPEWFYDIRAYAGDIPVLLVGNKIDLEENQVDTKKHAITLKENYNLSSLMSISAQLGENVDKMLEELIRLIMNRLE